MAGLNHEQIGVNYAARLLNVPTKELKAAILEERLIKGVQPPRVRARSGPNCTNWVFNLGDVLAVAQKLDPRRATFTQKKPKV